MDHTDGYWKCVERIREQAAAGLWSAAEAGAPRRTPGVRPAASTYLEQNSKKVTERKKREWLEVRKCGCGSWFCANCCLSQGIKLKERLKVHLRSFNSLMMLTLTIDPELFESPQAAFEYVSKRRCISVMIQRLDRWGLLQSRRYFCIIEWQANGWPHWHVLVESEHIPFDKLCEAWNRNYWDWRHRVSLGRPGFGSVRFSVPKFKSSDRAAGYACAYLTKHPQHGYPAWVMDRPTRCIHRYQTSRGFWKGESAGGEEAHEDSAPTDVESEDTDSASSEDGGSDVPVRTIAEQVSRCGSTCVVLMAREVTDESTGEVKVVREFVSGCAAEFSSVLKSSPDEVNARQTAAVFWDPAAAIDRLSPWLGLLSKLPVDITMHWNQYATTGE